MPPQWGRLVNRLSLPLAVATVPFQTRRSTNGNVAENLQLTAYALMVLIETGSEVAGLRIDAVVRTKTPKIQALCTSRSRTDYVRFFALAQAVRNAINAGCFYPNPGWQCPTCEFAEPCRRWGLNHL